MPWRRHARHKRGPEQRSRRIDRGFHSFFGGGLVGWGAGPLGLSDGPLMLPSPLRGSSSSSDLPDDASDSGCPDRHGRGCLLAPPVAGAAAPPCCMVAPPMATPLSAACALFTSKSLYCVCKCIACVNVKRIGPLFCLYCPKIHVVCGLCAHGPKKQH